MTIKKLFSTALLLVVITSFTACTKSEEKEETTNTSDSEQTENIDNTEAEEDTRTAEEKVIDAISNLKLTDWSLLEDNPIREEEDGSVQVFFEHTPAEGEKAYGSLSYLIDDCSNVCSYMNDDQWEDFAKAYDTSEASRRIVEETDIFYGYVPTTFNEEPMLDMSVYWLSEEKLITMRLQERYELDGETQDLTTALSDAEALAAEAITAIKTELE